MSPVILITLPSATCEVNYKTYPTGISERLHIDGIV